MGSQAVEILRQGVWASLTGGWCFDPHQTIFCNTFHLYVWLFLLCLPFAVYLYFPPTVLVWSVYCGTITLLFGALRLVTYQLHKMFDTTEPTVDLKATDVTNNPFQEHTTHREEEGIEMQVLGKVPTGGTGQDGSSSHTSYSGSVGPIAGSNESIPFWTDYSHTGLKSAESTNDIKVDVEGKENSERSEEFSGSRTFAEAEAVEGGLPSSRLVRSRPLRRRPGHCPQESKGGESSQKDTQNYACSSTPAVCNYVAGESSSNQLNSKEDPSNPSVVISVEYEPLERKDPPSRRFPQSTNGSLNVLPTCTYAAAETIKPTGSLELGNNMDVDHDKGLLYWKQHNNERGSGPTEVDRRIRSSALESAAPSGSSCTRGTDHAPSSPIKGRATRQTTRQGTHYQAEANASTSKRADSEDEDSNAGSHSPLLLNKRLGSKEKKSSPSDTTESATSIDKDKKTACECGRSETDDTLSSNQEDVKKVESSQTPRSKEDSVSRRSSVLSSTLEKCLQPNAPSEAAASWFCPADILLAKLIRSAEELHDPTTAGGAAMQRLFQAAVQAAEADGGDSKPEAAIADFVVSSQSKGVPESLLRTEANSASRTNQSSAAWKALSKKWKNLSHSGGDSGGGAGAPSTSGGAGDGDVPPQCTDDSRPSSALPSPESFDWLYKRTDSETEKSLGNQSRDLGQWNYTHSDDSDSSVSLPMHSRQDKDSCYSVGSSSSNSGTSQEPETKSLLVRNNNKGSPLRSLPWNRLAVHERRYKAGATGDSGTAEPSHFQLQSSARAPANPTEPVQLERPFGNNDNNSELLEAILSYLLKRVTTSLVNYNQADAPTSSAPAGPSSPPPPPPLPPPPPPLSAPHPPQPSTSAVTVGASHEQQRHDRRRERRKHHRLKRSTRMHRSRAHVRTRPGQDPMPAGASAASTAATSTPTATCASTSRRMSTSRGASSAVATSGTSSSAACGPQADSEVGEACALDSSNAPLGNMLCFNGAHLAASHDDTSDGALHFFKDEHGKVMTYVFDHKGSSESNLQGASLPPNNSTFLQSMLRLQKRRRRNAKRHAAWAQSSTSATDQAVAQVSSCSAPSPSPHLPAFPGPTFPADIPTLNPPNRPNPSPPPGRSFPLSTHALSSPSLAVRPRDFSTNVGADSDTLSSSPSLTSFDVNVSVESGTKGGAANAAAGTSDGTGDISPPYVLPASTPPPPCCHRRSQRGSMRPVYASSAVTPVYKSTPMGASTPVTTETTSDPLQAAVTQMLSTIQNRHRMEMMDRYRYQDRRRSSRPQPALRSHALEILLNDNLFRDIELRLERYEQYERNLEARRSQQTLERSSSVFAEQMSSVLQPYDGVLRPVSHSPKYYKYRIAPHVYFKVHLDRLELLAMLDRTVTVWETLLSVILFVLVAICGAQLLRSGYYRDVMAFLLCFTIAGCQYSLLKSVQPDAASPTHGHNRLVAYSRPAYFCLCSLLIFALESQLSPTISRAGVFNFNSGSYVNIYGLKIDPVYVTWRLRKFLADLLLFFPVVFSFGLFPQVNTFSMYFLEQVDMHIFGGNASSSLGASILCVFRSILAVLVLSVFAFGGLSRSKAQQHLLFSLFCGLLVAIAFHLSRCASDPAPLWSILKSQCRPPLDLTSVCERGAVSKRQKKRQRSKKRHKKNKQPVRCSERSAASSKGDNKSATGSSTLSNPSYCTNKTSSSDPQEATSLPSNEPLLEGGGEETCSRVSNPGQPSPGGATAAPATATSAPSAAPSAAPAETTISTALPEPLSAPTDTQEQPSELVDPLPQKLTKTVWMRVKSDMVVCVLLTIFVFGVHCSTVFTTLQPHLNYTLWIVAICLGFILHYMLPHLRKQLPWLCLSRPVFRSYEFNQFETKEAARIMWFEKMYVYLCFFERNMVYPAVVLGAVTWDAPKILARLGPIGGAVVVSVCALKCLRCCYSDATPQYLVLVFAILFFQFDFASASETFLVDYFVMNMLFSKVYEFLLKVQFVVTYIAPWQITWGSAFHAFAQPFSVPHSAMLFAQAAISALLSSPLSPFLGSAIFLASYVRPVKFWERDYNTRRVDNSNARLSSVLERNLGSDDNNLNSIFYEHLTRSLQHSLCGDLMMGRWGPVSQGDCFVLASENLNCLVHIVEMGNGLVTFQMRGLEFRGTYCQQREVEAITEEIGDNSACCCCCQPGHLPHVLSVNAAFSQRWLAWEVTATKYVLEGYSISVNNAISTLQTYDLRKVLVTYYVKSIIFYAVRSSKLEEWLSSPSILEALRHMWDRSFVDLDPVFNMNIDEDFDLRTSGITYSSFCSVYLDWILFCVSKREKVVETCTLQLLVTLCLALSLLGRRALGAAAHNYNGISSVDFFLHGLHTLFKGDFRITCARDEWIFSDVELMRQVLAPAIRMSLKLHLDHFMSSDEYDDPTALYSAITSHEENMVISHEGDPVWRNAVLAGTPSLLSLRHVSEEGKDSYRVIMLNKRFLSFRVIKMNRECVRGLWAGQQQELVYLRNRNPERGSIQNAKQALRNIINSSCDQPIGYPIYVSPLTTSYADTNEQLTSLVGGPLSLGAVKNAVIRAWRRIHKRCSEGCASGGAGGGAASNPEDGFAVEGVYAMTTFNMHSASYSQQSSGHNTSGSQSMDSAFGGRSTSLNRSNVPCVSGAAGIPAVASASSGVLGGALGNRGSLSSVHQCKTANPTLASLANLLSSSDSAKLQEHVLNIRESVREREREEERQRENVERERREETPEPVQQRVRIVDPNQVYDAINMGRRIDVVWPDEWMRQRGGRSHWRNWIPEKGMEGQVVHRWVPCHRDPNYRSHVDRTILLVKIEDKFVPIAESGVQDLGAEV